MFEPKNTLKNIECYSTDEFYPDCKLKLDSNENVFGPSLKVIEAFRNIDLRCFNLYPCYGEMLSILSEKFGFDKDNFLLTNGCDEAINIVLSAYLTEKDSILAYCPTFSMPDIYSKIIGAVFKKIDYISKWQFSIEELFLNIKNDTKIIYLASPNNPTGDIIKPSEIRKILEKCRDKIILLDLTYVNYSDYSENEYYCLVKEFKNLICVKSFSKDYALAGLRLGFILAQSDFISEFKKVISPYSVNSMAIFAGINALKDDKYFSSVKEEVNKSKAFLTDELKKLGFAPYSSQANFILVDFGPKVEFAYNKLLSSGIIVRKFSSGALKSCLRISIPPVEDAKKIIDALKPRSLLVFDLDGVVFDVSGSYRYAIQKTYEHFAGTVCEPCQMQAAKNLGGLSNDWDLTKYLLDKKGIKVDYSKLVEIFQSIFYNPEKTGSKGAIDNEKIVLGSEFFEKLSEKYDLAVFTGRPREEAFYSLRKFGIDKYFKYFVCLEDVPCGRSKPCPDGLNKIKQNCYYNNICFFGDTVDDAKAGCDAGVLTYGIIPPNAADVENTVKSLMDFGAADVIKSACEILEYNLFEEKTCRLKQ